MSEESKSYKLYEPNVGKVIISKDVSFEEANSWNWSKKDQENIIDSQGQMEEESEVELQEDADVTFVKVVEDTIEEPIDDHSNENNNGRIK